MNKTVLALVLAACAATAGAADYKIDSAHTNARFAIDHFNTSTNVGGFYGIEGGLQFDAAKRTGSIDVRVPMKNLQTSSDAFTHHLKSADLFNAEKFPEMRFVSSKFHFSGNRVTAVDGQLTLLGQTHPVRFAAQKFNCYESPMLKTQVCGGDFTATIDRTKWGMNYLVDAGMTKNVTLTLQVEAAKQ